MQKAMEKEPRGTIARFEACGCGYFRFAQRYPAHMRIMFRPELACPDEHPGVDAAAEAALNHLSECVAECQRAGTMAAGDTTTIVLMSWATAHGLASLWLDGPLPRLRKWAAPPQSLPLIVARTLGALLATRNR
jgi:hypothetical protein